MDNIKNKNDSVIYFEVKWRTQIFTNNLNFRLSDLIM